MSGTESTVPAAHTRGMHANTLANLAGFGLPILVSLVAVPRYLDLVGQARYGVLLIVWIMLGYFGVFDLGLGRATTHEMAQTDPNDPEDGSAVFWTATAVNAVMGVIGGLVLLPVAYVLVKYAFKVPNELRSEVIDSLPILAVAMPLVTVSSVFSGALQGRERFIASNALNVFYGVLFQLAPLAVAEWHGPNLVLLIGTAIGAQFATTLLGFVMCVVLVPARRVRFDRSRVSRLFRFGAWISVTGVISPLLTILDRLAVGIAVGAAGVTRYSVPFNVATRLWIIPISFARTAFPRLAVLKKEDAEEVAQSVCGSLFRLLTPLVILGLLIFEPFLHLWVGTQLGPQAPRIGEILLLGAWIDGLAYVPNVFLQAQKRPEVTAKIHMIEIVPFLIVLWVGLKAWGVEGGALAWTLRSTADSVLVFWASYVPWRIQKGFVSGFVLLVAAFVLAFAFPGTSNIRIGGDVLLFGLTLAWSWSALPPSSLTLALRSLRRPLRPRESGAD